MGRYLVTGGAGFIGSHLTESLIQDGHSVIVLDDLSSGNVDNLKAVISHPRLDFHEGNVLGINVLEQLIREVDVVFHLAATVGVLNIVKNPVVTIANNVNGTEAVLQAAAENKTKVVIASTSEVYGKSHSTPFGEDDDLVLGSTHKARWSYAASKIIDEFLALAWWRERHVPTVIVRLFNTIGPRQIGHYGMVVPRFLSQALRGENLSVYGSGVQTRCFSYVGDIVQWLKILSCKDEAVGQIFNLGNPKEISIFELAELVVSVTGSRSGVTLVPYHLVYGSGFEDIDRRVPNTSRVVGLTGYRPQVDLEEALRITSGWVSSSGIAW